MNAPLQLGRPFRIGEKKEVRGVRLVHFERWRLVQEVAAFHAMSLRPLGPAVVHNYNTS